MKLIAQTVLAYASGTTEKVYEIDTPVQSDEVDKDNNKVERIVHVREAKLIKVLYVLGIVGAAVWALILAGTGISQGGVGLLLALVSPVLFLAGVIYFRMMMEVIMVIFRGAEHLAEIAKQGRQAR